MVTQKFQEREIAPEVYCYAYIFHQQQKLKNLILILFKSHFTGYLSRQQQFPWGWNQVPSARGF